MPVSQADMMRVMTAGYRPPSIYKPTFLQYGLPPFTLATVEWMRRDPHVRLAMAIKLAPYSVVKLTIKGDRKVAEFMAKMIRRFWMKAIPKITRAFWYTRSGGEIVYTQQQGQYEFWNYLDVYPADISILVKRENNQPVGISVKPSTGVNDPNSAPGTGFGTATNQDSEVTIQPTRLFFPKGFLYLHNREFNALSGQSEFEAAYEPWLEKTDAQGAKHSRKLWFYKSAFSGGILLHPPGSYIDEDNQEVPYALLARQALETSLNGAVWTFEQKYDPITKQPMWQFIEPKMNPGGGEILSYVDSLDNEIMRGIGIPDDVVKQVGGTGSYAGRSIPLMAFFIAQRTTLNNLFNVCDEQVFRPLCRANFGHDNYEAIMEIDVERLMGEMQEGSSDGSLRSNEASFSQGELQNTSGTPMQPITNQKLPSQFAQAKNVGGTSSQLIEHNTFVSVSRAMALTDFSDTILPDDTVRIRYIPTSSYGVGF